MFIIFIIELERSGNQAEQTLMLQKKEKK